MTYRDTGTFPLASNDTMAFETTNAPTPASISPVPYDSVLAKRRGNITKSTPRMQIAVAMFT